MGNFDQHKDARLPWDSLLFVAAAGGVALFFVYLGAKFFANKSLSEGSSGGGISGMDDFSFSPADSAPRAALAPYQSPVLRGKVVSYQSASSSSTIRDNAERIVPSSTYGKTRYATVTTDQAIRVATSRAGLSATSGIYIDSGSPRRIKLAPGNELWAVRTDPTVVPSAFVGVMTEF